MGDDFDVIVVGARCAGSPLATLLARAGMRVCVVDRSRFPSDTASTHGIQPTGVKILEQLGVLEPLLKVTTPIERGVLALDDARIEISGLTEKFGAPMINARRITLDVLLVEAAAAAGAEIRTETAVTGLIEENGRVAGVRTKDGPLRARLVVGADGVQSAVARFVGAREYHQTQSGRLFMWAYFEDANADRDSVWLGKVVDHCFLACPTDDGLFMAATGPSADRRDELLGDREGSYADGLARWPELQATVEGARRVGPIRVKAQWRGYFRESAGPGWALVGDAGHFKDPTPGQGIADALRQVVELATAIEKALGGPGNGDQVLRDWWQWRDRDAWEMYWFAYDLGAAGPTPMLVQEMQLRIAADPHLTGQLMSVINHDLLPSSVFTPGLALSVTSRALAKGRGRRKTLLRDARTLARDEIRRGLAGRRLAAMSQA